MGVSFLCILEEVYMKVRFEEFYGNSDSITLNVTNNCNLACSYCFETDKTRAMMKPEIAVEAIKKAYSPNAPNTMPYTINFFGGEPLLNWPAIKAVIDYCNENNLKVQYGFTTNLTILTEEMLDYMDDNSIPFLVSIDGIKQVHDKNRCNSYDTVMSNLKRIIDRGLGIYIEARMTVLPEDVKYLLQGVKEIYNMGINNICPIPVTDVVWSDEQLKDLEQFYLDITDFFIEEMSKENNTRSLSIKNVDDIIQVAALPNTYDTFMCSIYDKRWCAVDYRGDVYACHQGPTSNTDIKEMLYIGNLDWVDDEKYKNRIIHGEYIKEECNGCIAKAICKCGCPVENLRETNQYMKPTDSYCEIKRIIMRAISSKLDDIMNIEHSNSRILTITQENLKLKAYVDKVYDSFMDKEMDDLARMQLLTQVDHIQDLIDNMKGNVLIKFREYIDEKLKNLLAILLTMDGISYNQLKEVLANGKECS
mgnify:FL=1